MPHGRMTFGQWLGRQKMAEVILFSIENSFSKKWEDFIFFETFLIKSKTFSYPIIFHSFSNPII
jgi:hypothetical protein